MNTTTKINSFKSIFNYYLFNKKTPLSVVLLITDKCNSRCKYCEIWNRNEEEMTTKQVYSLIDDLSDMGAQKFSIFGGEPLLREDIGKIIGKRGHNVAAIRTILGAASAKLKKRVVLEIME